MTDVYVSTGAFRSRQLSEILATSAGAGLSRIELSGGVDSRTFSRSLLLDCPATTRFLVHNYFPPDHTGIVINLASASAEIRDASVAFCTNAIRLAGSIGSFAYSVHAGFCVDPLPHMLGGQAIDLPKTHRDVARDHFYASLEELQYFAAEEEILLCVENNVIESFNLSQGRNDLVLLTSPFDFDDFVSQPELRSVGILLDVGHLKVSARAEGFDASRVFDVIADRAAMLHLSDNSGIEDQNAPYDAEAWFWRQLTMLRSVRSATIEVYGLDIDELVALHELTGKLLGVHLP